MGEYFKTDNLHRLLEGITKEFTTFDFGKLAFPHLFVYGLDNAAVHAAGVSYINALGIKLGIPAISEYPISLNAPKKWVQAGRIFPDSVWFHPDTMDPWIVFEFERFEKGDENKIRQKAENLVISHHQSGGSIELGVFVYWLRTSLAPKSLQELLRVFQHGCTRNGVDVPPPSCRFEMFKFIMCPCDQRFSSCLEEASVLFSGVERTRTKELLLISSIQHIRESR